MTCPVCQQEIESGSATCPRCGAQLVPTLSDAQRKGGLRATIVLFVISLAVMAVFMALILRWHEEQQRTLLLEQQVAIEAELDHDEAQIVEQEPVSPPEVEQIPSE